MNEAGKKKNGEVENFIQGAQTMLKQDKGSRAVLKRAAGQTMAEAGGNALTAFYHIQGIPRYQEEKYFAVVCIMCLWSDTAWEKVEPLIEGARIKVGADSRSGFEKRLQALLDLSWDEDGYFLAKLLRLVKFCKSKEVVVDPVSLLEDLLNWEHESRFVQKKWVRDFYHLDNRENKKGANENVN